MSERDRAGRPAQESEGKTLYAYLTEHGVSPAACGGKGICGRCLVRYREEAPLPVQAERRLLPPDQLRGGYRLACLHAYKEGVQAEVCFGRGRETAVVDAFLAEDRPENGPAGGNGQRCGTAAGTGQESDTTAGQKRDAAAGQVKPAIPTVLAIDLGTTTIAMQLREKESGAVLGAYRCFNPQRRYGADVVSRMRAAAEGKAEELRLLALHALEEGAAALLRDAAAAGYARPRLAALAGNTVMCHLLLGWDTAPLAAYPFQPRSLDEAELQLAGLKTLVLPGFSAFVGADVLAGALALGLDLQQEREPGRAGLLVDLGTNGEIALFCGENCFCTATAAGPAFEGGANAAVPGSDMTALMAGLLREGVMDFRGLLREPYFTEGVIRDGVKLRQKDVRDFQLAKAAVRAGLELLLQKADAGACPEIQVWLAGGFGYFLDEESAFAVGMLPRELLGHVRTAGNTSLQGAWLYAGEPEKMGRRARALKARMQVCNLAQEPAFTEKYPYYIDFPEPDQQESKGASLL